jgi:hypothetical protein
VSSDDNEFEILMGRIGNQRRRESFLNEVLRARRASGCRTSFDDRKEGWSGGRPLGVGARQHRVQPQPAVRR